MAVSDIIVSPATIWYAPVGEALPAVNTIDAGEAWGGNWASLGYTLEPISLSLETATFDLFVEQLTVPVRTIRTQVDALLKTKLAEFTGVNLKLAMDGTLTTTAPGAAQVGYDSIVMDATKTDVSLFAVGIEGVRVSNANARLPVRIFLHRASIVLSGDVEFAKGAGVGIPITIKALADAATNAAMTIQNVTAPFTA